MTDEPWNFMIEAGEHFGFKVMGDHHDAYAATDVTGMADGMENMREA